MGYLEIIGIGYLLNIASYGLVIIIAIINTIMAFSFGSPLDILEQSKALKSLQTDYNELKQLVPKNVSRTPEDVALFFPFMLVFSVFKLLFFSLKYGMNNYLIYKMQARLTKMETWLKEQ